MAEHPTHEPAHRFQFPNGGFKSGCLIKNPSFRQHYVSGGYNMLTYWTAEYSDTFVGHWELGYQAYDGDALSAKLNLDDTCPAGQYARLYQDIPLQDGMQYGMLDLTISFDIYFYLHALALAEVIPGLIFSWVDYDGTEHAAVTVGFGRLVPSSWNQRSGSVRMSDYITLAEARTAKSLRVSLKVRSGITRVSDTDVYFDALSLTVAYAFDKPASLPIQASRGFEQRVARTGDADRTMFVKYGGGGTSKLSGTINFSNVDFPQRTALVAMRCWAAACEYMEFHHGWPFWEQDPLAVVLVDDISLMPASANVQAGYSGSINWEQQ